MPMKLNLGLSKKIGQPNYGSLGASCHLELELDQSIVADPDGFQDRVRRTFTVCRQAVDDELGRRSFGAAGESTARVQSASIGGDSVNGANGTSTNGHHDNGYHRYDLRATHRQMDYAEQLAGQIKGLGIPRLESLVGNLYGKPIGDLSSVEASELIDVLKDIKTGKIDLATAPQWSNALTIELLCRDSSAERTSGVWADSSPSR